MPFAPAAKEEGNIEERQRKLPESWTIQVVLSVAGGAVCAWLFHRTDFHAIHPLPAFADRLRQLRIPLLEYLACIVCLGWFGVLMALRRLQKEVTEPNKLPRNVRWILWAVGLLALAGELGEQIERVLWPEYSLKIQLASALTILLIGLATPFVKQWGRKTRIPQRRSEYVVQPEPRAVSTNVLLALVLAVGVLGSLGLMFAAKHYAPGHGRIAGVAAVIFWGICFLVWEILQRPVDGAPRPAAEEDSSGNETRDGFRRRLRGKMWSFLYGTLVVALISLPLQPRVKPWIIYGQFGLALVAAMVVRRLRKWIYDVGHGGDFARALRLDRMWSWLPFYSSPLQGSILFNAGRYREARQFLKPLAFDGQGQPRLSSVELYSYALCLVNDGCEEEAEKLLEAAVRVVERPDGMKVALSSCLLSQNKDPDRACRLLEEVLGSSRRVSHEDQVKRIARYAWALASCGRRQESEAKLQEAIQKGAGLSNADMAGVQYFVGEAWRAMDQTANARGGVR